jgi:cob(I)alamin adenosyltransferase
MKIYTKGGDTGQTGLFGGQRVSKDHKRIQTYGTLDELNAVLGMALAEPGAPAALSSRLLRVQGELFQAGAELATPRDKSPGIELIDEPQVEALEREIDEMETDLPPLKNFILPGGTRLAAVLHLARTVCRRAERELVSLHHDDPVRPVLMRYLNRVSDHLFVSARWANLQGKVTDTPWVPRRPGA